MRPWKNPHEHFEEHLTCSAHRYVDGRRQAGLSPNPTLTNAMAERAVQEATDSYVRETLEIRDHNIAVIVQEHRQRLNAIKRRGARQRLWTCPPIALCFGLMAWYSFTAGEGLLIGLCYLAGSLTFLAMLVLGAVFDRPTREP